jgi:hypothetical protein
VGEKNFVVNASDPEAAGRRAGKASLEIYRGAPAPMKPDYVTL